MHKHFKAGFTIVELAVAVVIIAILAVIATFSLTKVQEESRDAKRASQATVISEALEKYYDKNGEYP
jgi:prepilin-type N-terminal cleavage/methylation domain-containing protein